jgi:hypothetical protein
MEADVSLPEEGMGRTWFRELPFVLAAGTCEISDSIPCEMALAIDFREEEGWGILDWSRPDIILSGFCREPAFVKPLMIDAVGTFDDPLEKPSMNDLTSEGSGASGRLLRNDWIGKMLTSRGGCEGTIQHNLAVSPLVNSR